MLFFTIFDQIFRGVSATQYTTAEYYPNNNLLVTQTVVAVLQQPLLTTSNIRVISVKDYHLSNNNDSTIDLSIKNETTILLTYQVQVNNTFQLSYHQEGLVTYRILVDAITNSVHSGNFTTILRQYATTNQYSIHQIQQEDILTNNMYNVSALLVVNSSLPIIQVLTIGTNSPTNAPSSSPAANNSNSVMLSILDIMKIIAAVGGVFLLVMSILICRFKHSCCGSNQVIPINRQGYGRHFYENATMHHVITHVKSNNMNIPDDNQVVFHILVKSQVNAVVVCLFLNIQ